MKSSKLDLRKEEFENLFNRGLSDYKIAKEMKINHCTIFQWRKKNGYLRPSLKEAKEISLTKDNIEVLIGTLLGDGCLRITNLNARYINSHGPRQKEYAYYIAEQLGNLGAKVQYSKRHKIDIRTGIKYESYSCVLPSNPALNYLYCAFYRNKTKKIPIELLENFTSKSLAFMYMDDGNKTRYGYSIATMCFAESEILEFRKFLFKKFNLETSMFKDGRIYILHKSANHFKELILPYIHKTMMYKL